MTLCSTSTSAERQPYSEVHGPHAVAGCSQFPTTVLPDHGGGGWILSLPTSVDRGWRRRNRRTHLPCSPGTAKYTSGRHVPFRENAGQMNKSTGDENESTLRQGSSPCLNDAIGSTLQRRTLHRASDRPLWKRRASGSVLEACVSFLRRSPLRPGQGGSREPSPRLGAPRGQALRSKALQARPGLDTSSTWVSRSG
jgi:hypothetical protein